jgi:hypothetical protein
MVAALVVGCLGAATAALIPMVLVPGSADAVVTAGVIAFLLGGPMLAWLALGRIARAGVAALIAVGVLVPYLVSAVFPGSAITPSVAAWLIFGEDAPAVSPPAVDWILPAGWTGAALCVVALLLDRLPRRTPLWPVWFVRGGGLDLPRWRRLVGVWALTGAVLCGAVSLLLTPEGVPAAFPNAAMAMESVPVPPGWTVLGEDRDCPRRRCGEHAVAVRAPIGVPPDAAAAAFLAALPAAGWPRRCRAVLGVSDWGERCVHLYRSGTDPARFSVVVNGELPNPCFGDGDLLAVPRKGMVFCQPGLILGRPTIR